MKQNQVVFGDIRYVLDEEASLDDVRATLMQSYPAVQHAHGEVIVNADGSKTYQFTQKAGTKG